MGKKRKRKRMKKQAKLIILLSLFLVILIGIFAIIVLTDKEEPVVFVPIIEEEPEPIMEVGIYQLCDNATDYQTELFMEIKKLLETDDYSGEALARLVAKGFIAEYFTLSNVTSKTAGGLQYVPEALKERFSAFASDIYAFYPYYTDREKMLVKEVTISNLKSITYDYSDDAGTIPNKLDLSGYEITTNWTYKNNESYTTTLEVVKWNDDYGVVSVQN